MLIGDNVCVVSPGEHQHLTARNTVCNLPPTAIETSAKLPPKRKALKCWRLYSCNKQKEPSDNDDVSCS